MKRLFSLILLLCLFTSCSGAREDYFSRPRTLEVTVTQGDISLSGVLVTHSEGIAFYPRSPRGLAVVISKDGGEVTLDGITFGRDNAAYTRLYPLYEALMSKEVTLTYKKGCDHPVTVEGKGFKLTVHKETDL